MEHVRIRAWERLGEHVDQEECLRIARDIQEGQNAERIVRISFRCSIWRVRIKGVPAIVIYDHEMRIPITILTEQMWQERSLCNSPKVSDPTPLKENLGSNIAIIEELTKLKENCNE